MNEQKSEVLQDIRNIVESVVKENKEYYKIWKEDVLFSWEWWYSLFLFIVPIILWFIFRKKESTDRLWYAGFFVLLIASWLDFVGNSYGLWYYPYKLLPTIPPYFPWETVLCFEVMFLLQFRPHVSPWIKGIGFGIFNSFVAEPINKWLGLYVLVHWKTIYSFPIYVVVYIIAHLLSRKNHFVKLR